MNASARADGASHHCRSSTSSASGKSAERFDASQYRPCCQAYPGSPADGRGAAESDPGAPVITSSASAAAPASQRSRSPGSASSSGRSSNWRITPNGNPRSSSVARALRTRTPWSDPHARASSSSRDFPMPAAPSTIRTSPARCPTARRAARMRSTSRSRSSSAPGEAMADPSMRQSIVRANAGAAQCSGSDVRGCARCAARRVARR